MAEAKTQKPINKGMFVTNYLQSNKRNVYFVRHGESKTNAKGTFGTDGDLTPTGIKQAQRAGIDFDEPERPFMAICSDKLRAIETIFTMFPTRSNFVIDRRFREINFGELEGQQITPKIEKEIQSKPLLIREKYLGDDIIKRTDEAIKAVRDYLLISDLDLVIVGHDTLFELIFLRLGVYKGKEFRLWTPKYKMANGEVRSVDSNLFFEQEEEKEDEKDN